MLDMLSPAPFGDAWPALGLPLFGVSLTVALVMLAVVVVLVAVAGPTEIPGRRSVRRLHGTRAA